MTDPWAVEAQPHRKYGRRSKQLELNSGTVINQASAWPGPQQRARQSDEGFLSERIA